MQRSFADMEYAAKKRVTQRYRFLGELDALVPCAELVAAIEPFHPKAGHCGRQPKPPHSSSADKVAESDGCGGEPGHSAYAKRPARPERVGHPTNQWCANRRGAHANSQTEGHHASTHHGFSGKLHEAARGGGEGQGRDADDDKCGTKQPCVGRDGCKHEADSEDRCGNR